MEELLVNVGGAKGWVKFPVGIKEKWTCLDRAGVPGKCVVHNLNEGKPFPFADASVKAYYSSHTFEHVYIELLPFTFSELYRTLSPGGTLRIVVPDMEKGFDAYRVRKLDRFHRGPTVPEYFPQTELGKLMAWWTTPDQKSNASGHHSAFDWDTMAWYLQKAGFRNVVRKEFNVYASVFKEMDFPRYADFSLYVEAEK